MRIGSIEHRDLACGEFVNSFKSFEASEVQWPELDRMSAARVRAMPFWNEALNSELVAADRTRRMAEAETDSTLREAIGLQAFEKGRRADLLEGLMRRYGIKLHRFRGERRRSPEWGYMRMGNGELFDMFFAFGLFRLIAHAQLLPPGLIAIFEDVMAEEARHLIFFHNWSILRSRQAPIHRKPVVIWHRSAAMAVQTVGRIRTGIRVATTEEAKDPADDFVMWAPSRLWGDAISYRHFIQICLGEYRRRMDVFDPKLPRPLLVPAMVRVVMHLMREPRATRPARKLPLPERANQRPVSVSRTPQHTQSARFRRPG
ncbi:MAG: hypothetical protein ABSG46_06470 [Candidatus Binataceae bacterium]|jgi:hypothetical protein